LLPRSQKVEMSPQEGTSLLWRKGDISTLG
jgi:hypothetical protein